jgi:hypothetical protein
VDAIVAVTRVGFASRAALNDLRRHLLAAPAPALGVVVAGVRVPAVGNYARYSRYAHSGEYGGAAQNGKSDRLPRRIGV